MSSNGRIVSVVDDDISTEHVLLKSKKNSITVGVVIFVVFYSTTFLTDIAFGAGERY